MEKPNIFEFALRLVKLVFAGRRVEALSWSNRYRSEFHQRDETGEALYASLLELLADERRYHGGYDYGQGFFYQSSPSLHIHGLRDSAWRIREYELAQLVGGKDVLDVGSNSGFLACELGYHARSIVGCENNAVLVEMANSLSRYLGLKDVQFNHSTFEDFFPDKPFDVTLALASHETLDGMTTFYLSEFLDKVLACTSIGGSVVFESHPRSIERVNVEEVVDLVGCDFESFRVKTIGKSPNILDSNRYVIFLDGKIK